MPFSSRFTPDLRGEGRGDSCSGATSCAQSSPKSTLGQSSHCNVASSLALLLDVSDELNNALNFDNAENRSEDMVRVGIATYGIEPAAGIGGELGLEPAMSLRSQLSMVKPVFAGESVSYGFQHTFAHDTVIGTVPMGYADGLRRDAYARGAQVLIGGKRRPIVGVVTMDQAMVDLGVGSIHQAGDEVVIIGSQGDDTISVPDIAELLDTIPYEIICDIGRRVRRRYL